MNELPKAYEPQQHEDEIYKKWMESGLFNPDVCIEKGLTQADAEPFSIVLPPPNVTGTLHLGHAVMLAIQDMVTRFARMRGKKTLWIPGTDHAAIATQSKVEKKVWEEEGKTRYDLGREPFLDRVRAFAQQSHDTIVNQMKKMGASVDWSREAYTLDDARTRAVYTAFKRMYDDGLIYRGFRVVNWDPKGGTTVSDDEVVHKESTATLYTFSYAKNFPIAISTTRPETKVGDTAVAVHPDDARYAEYVGKTFENIPFAGATLTIRVIADKRVDPEFGTGALGVTPAHSAIDADMAREYGIPSIQVIDEYARMTEQAGEMVEGKTTLEAREIIVQWLRENHLLNSEVETMQNLSVAERSGGIIEPIPKEQWFIDVNKSFEHNGETKTLKTLMQDAVKSGNVQIIPERFVKTYFHWIDNLRDWCISRQIWFGHRVPAYYCVMCQQDHIDVALKANINRVSSGNMSALLQMMSPSELMANVKEVSSIRGGHPVVSVETPTSCERCGGTWFVQDPDTLDTWFSSGLWTFSTLGWPDKTNDLATYHPTTLLETGYDILFFWVARMILMSGYLMNDVPFKHVYLHGLIRDEQGRKMSKSLDNIIDPLDMIEQFGADATRLSLMIGISPGNDAKLSVEKVAGFRNFANKLYNIGRFVLTSTDIKVKQFHAIDQETYDALPWEDQWIIGRLKEVAQQTTASLEHYDVARALDDLKQFTWNEFADWYIEIAKIQGNKDAVLRYAFDTILKLWHPAMPYVTEHIWSLSHDSMLMVQPWPVLAIEPNRNAIDRADELQKIISTVRSMRAESRIPAAARITLMIEADDDLSSAAQASIKTICRVDTLIIKSSIDKQIDMITAMAAGYPLYIPMEGLVDVQAEQKRLKKEIENLTAYIEMVEKKLANEEFVNNAPAVVVESERKKLDDARVKRDTLAEKLESV